MLGMEISFLYSGCEMPWRLGWHSKTARQIQALNVVSVQLDRNVLRCCGALSTVDIMASLFKYFF